MQPAMDGPGDGEEENPSSRDVELVAGPVELGNIEYYLLPGTKYYVREDNVQIGSLEADGETGWDVANETAGAYDSVNEVGVKFTDDLGKAMEKGGGKAAAGMGEGADSFNILGGLAQWASAITSEKEKKVDWASAGLDLVEGAGKMSAGISGLVDKANLVSQARRPTRCGFGERGSCRYRWRPSVDSRRSATPSTCSSIGRKRAPASGPNRAWERSRAGSKSGVKAAKGFSEAWGGAGPLPP